MAEADIFLYTLIGVNFLNPYSLPGEGHVLVPLACTKGTRRVGGGTPTTIYKTNFVLIIKAVGAVLPHKKINFCLPPLTRQKRL